VTSLSAEGSDCDADPFGANPFVEHLGYPRRPHKKAEALFGWKLGVDEHARIKATV